MIRIVAHGAKTCGTCSRMSRDNLQRAWCLPLEAPLGAIPGLGAVLCCNARAEGAECGPSGAMHRPGDLQLLAEREAQRRVPPYWMFGPRTARQERIEHPALEGRS